MNVSLYQSANNNRLNGALEKTDSQADRPPSNLLHAFPVNGME